MLQNEAMATPVGMPMLVRLFVSSSIFESSYVSHQSGFIFFNMADGAVFSMIRAPWKL